MIIISAIGGAVLLIFASLAVFAGLRYSHNKPDSQNLDQAVSGKEREAVLKNANRRLAANPKDTDALKSLATLYYNDGDYKKAMRTYQLLLGQRQPSSAMDEGEINLRFGISALQCGNLPEAYQALVFARSKNPENFQILLNLGIVETLRENYQHAITFLKKASQLKPFDKEARKYLGQCFYKMKRYSEATVHFKHIMEHDSADADILFAYACCELESSKLESAHKSFRKLRMDPKWGAEAALHSGSIFAKKMDWERAIADYHTGLKHDGVSENIAQELKYKLAEAYSMTNNVDKALSVYKEISQKDPHYKDIEYRIAQHEELNSNKNFQLYLRSPITLFVRFASKIIHVIYPKANVNVQKVTHKKNEYIEFVVNVVGRKREELVLFRFMRVDGTVGEFFVRDFYSQLKEFHAVRGLFFTPGSFSIEAVRFAEARPIELCDKDELLKVLNKTDTSDIDLSELSSNT